MEAHFLPLLDINPIQIEDKEHALSCLELLSRLNDDVILPIDWFDIRMLLEQNRRFWFYPSIKANNMAKLFEQVRHCLAVHMKGHSVHCVLWLDYPAGSSEQPDDIFAYFQTIRKAYPVSLLGINSSRRASYTATLCVMEGKPARERDNWALIKGCVQDAETQKVDQADMAAFLKRTFCTALDTLEEMVADGLDLSDKDVVANLSELILAINQIPQGRVRAFSVSTVIDEFEELVERFYGILAQSRQNAETSFTCDWLVSRLNSLAYEPDKVDAQKLKRYLGIAETLVLNGSDKILAYMAEAAEHLAHELTSEWLQDEAKKVWQFTIEILSRENSRITQREGRLQVDTDILNSL